MITGYRERYETTICNVRCGEHLWQRTDAVDSGRRLRAHSAVSEGDLRSAG